MSAAVIAASSKFIAFVVSGNISILLKANLVFLEAANLAREIEEFHLNSITS
jgi:hypothetical protein